MNNKKGLILIYPGYQNEAKQYQYNRLIEEFNKKGISIDKLKVDEQYTSVINGKVNIDAKEYDFCIQLVKDKYINEELCKNGIRSFNSYNAIENCDDKMMTYAILSNKNISFPNTILGSINFGVENMEDWSNRIYKYLLSDDRDILKDAGKISHEIAEEKALTEFEKYRVIQDKLYKYDFDKLLLEAEEDS